MHGASLFYNLLLARHASLKEKQEEYTELFQTWCHGIEVTEMDHWSLERLWELIDNSEHRITTGTRRFIPAGGSLVRENRYGILNSEKAIDLIKTRETGLKKAQSCLGSFQTLIWIYRTFLAG